MIQYVNISPQVYIDLKDYKNVSKFNKYWYFIPNQIDFIGTFIIKFLPNVYIQRT